jgi:hypothetical protein
VPDSEMPEATRSILDPLYSIAKCQLREVARVAEPDLRTVVRRFPGLCKAARRGPGRQGVVRDSPTIWLCNTARSELAIAKARPEFNFKDFLVCARQPEEDLVDRESLGVHLRFLACEKPPEGSLADIMSLAIHLIYGCIIQLGLSQRLQRLDLNLILFCRRQSCIKQQRQPGGLMPKPFRQRTV